MTPRSVLSLAVLWTLVISVPAAVVRAEDGKAVFKKCKAGDGKSCLRLAHAFRKTGKKRDQASARALFKLACKHSQASGCDDYGVMLATGVGGPKDPATAEKMFHLACYLGYAHGCYNLGALYYHGNKVKKDLKRARKLFKKACDGDVASGCGNLALMHYRGEGGPKDPRASLPLFDKGCKGGSKLACKALKTPEISALKGGGKKPKGGNRPVCSECGAMFGHRPVCSKRAA